jgi:hypothetical protein
MGKTSRVKTSKWPALTITRIGFQADELVYVAMANKSIRYPSGQRSAIAYIGTTKNGVSRIASSAAYKARDILAKHGIRHLEFYVVTAQAKRRVNIPRKLERALLMRFRERFGSVPVGNNHGKKLVWQDELEFFAYHKLDKILDEYA